jgi:hypothetical protein
MLGSEILEVAIGVIFLFALVSIICTAVREGIESWLKTRSAYLERGIRELLDDPAGDGLAKELYTHPVVYSLYSGAYDSKKVLGKGSLAWGRDGLPSYIPSRSFATALLDIAARGPSQGATVGAQSPVTSFESIRANIDSLGNPAVQRVLLGALDSAQGDMDALKADLERWFDSTMDRVSGWYRRSTQRVLFLTGLAVAVLLNVNTITIADYLYRNEAARAVVIEQAKTPPGGTQDAAAVEARLDKLGLPIGWDAGWGSPRPGQGGIFNTCINPVLGLLLTALAATLGAPFWFDVMNKVMVIRSTVKPHEKSPEEASEDRQLPLRPAPPVAPNVASHMPGSLALPAVATGVAARPDSDSHIDSCGLGDKGETPDEALPQAEGGVQ